MSSAWTRSLDLKSTTTQSSVSVRRIRSIRPLTTIPSESLSSIVFSTCSSLSK